MDLDEAYAVVNAHECRTHGHDFVPLVNPATGDPARIYCGRCGLYWNVVKPT